MTRHEFQKFDISRLSTNNFFLWASMDAQSLYEFLTDVPADDIEQIEKVLDDLREELEYARLRIANSERS